MREQCLRGRRKARFVKTTDSAHRDPVAENVLARDFTAKAPNEKWAGDITYIWTGCGWMYLAVVIDLFSRRVVGWAMADNMRAGLAGDALKMAVGRRCPHPGLIFHSDRGSQYTSAEYQALLAAAGAVCSMSRKGNCWDNAVSESFFATLKKELIHRFHWLSRRDAAAAVAEYIEIFYNNYRMHSSIGYASPAEFEHLNSTPQSAQLAA
jgi:transposase InsO family protein